MKQKLFIFLLSILTCYIHAHAEDVIVNKGTSKSDAYPFNTYYFSSVTQTIYLASEMGNQKGSINAIAFDVIEASELSTYGVRIYMAHTSKNKFSGVSDYVKESDLTLVYSSTPTIGSKVGWENYTLTTPFEYDGHSNVVLVVERRSNEQNQKLKYGYAFETDMSMSKGSLRAEAQIDGDYSLVSGSRPNLRVSFDEATMVEKKGFDEITIGNGETSSFFRPYYNAALYSTAYHVYSPQEMRHSGIITEISYFHETSPSSLNTDEVCIYMGHKNGDSFTDATDYPANEPTLGKTHMTLVYSGSPVIGSGWGCETIKLNTPFQYDNSMSLVVAVCKKSSKINQKIQYYCTYYTDRNVELSRFSTTNEKYGEIGSNIELTMGSARPNTKFRMCQGVIDGDTDVIIGNTVDFTNSDPYSVGSLSSAHQILFTPKEVGGKMLVTDIAFNVAESSETYINSLSIYMAHSKEAKFPITVFKPNGECVEASEFQLVYHGSPTLGKQTGWENLHLDTPFEYDGFNSLVVAVCHSSEERNMNLKYNQVNTGTMCSQLSSNTAELKSDYYMGYYSRPQTRLTGVVYIKTIDDITYRFNDDYTATVSYSPNASGDIEIPTTVINGGIEYQVNSVDEGAFSKNTSIRSVTIPKTITSLSSNVFKDCTNLENVILHDGITTIKSGAFAGCIMLQSISLPSALKEISGFLFDGCTSLKEIILPEGVTSLGSMAFRGCTGLTKFRIPSSVTYISNDVFNGCTGLEELRIPSTVKTIEDGALKDCSGIKRLIVLSKSVSLSSFNGSGAIIYAYADNIGTNYYKHQKRVITNPYYALYDAGQDFTSIYFCIDDIREETTIPFVVSCDNRLVEPTMDNTYNVSGLFIGTNYEIKVNVGDNNMYSHFIATKTPIIKQDSGLKNKQTTIYIDMYCHTFTEDFVPVKLGVICEDGRDIYTTDLSFVEEDYPYYHAYFVIKDFCPNTSYLFTPYVVYSNMGNQLIYGDQFTRKTAEIMSSISNQSVTPTTFACKGLHEVGNATFSKSFFTINGEQYDGDSLFLSGLDPETNYSISYTTIVEEGESTSTIDTRFKTGKIELSAPVAVPMTSSNTRVNCISNLDEHETNVGFQWRKYDAPESLASNEGNGSIFDNKIQGIIKNLQSTYYKVRAFYKSNNGTYTFSNWTTFDPNDFSYVEPIVYTYPYVETTETTASIRYLMLEGSDIVINQGIEYWINTNDSQHKVNTKSDSTSSNFVYVTGQNAFVSLENLTPGTQYNYRAFITTENGTYYGNTQSFLTAGDPTSTNIEETKISDDNIIAEDEYYDMKGRIASGQMKGIYIKKSRNGTTKKVFIK